MKRILIGGIAYLIAVVLVWYGFDLLGVSDSLPAWRVIVGLSPLFMAVKVGVRGFDYLLSGK